MSIAAVAERTQLTAAEIERGWVEFHCDRHGFLVATTPNASVWCKCSKQARRLRNGRILNPDTLRPTQAKARADNLIGQPFLYGCGDCGEDFHGRTLQRRHRVGRGNAKRCLTESEMKGKGWHRDMRGRWRRALAAPEIVALRPVEAAEDLEGESHRPESQERQNAGDLPRCTLALVQPFDADEPHDSEERPLPNLVEAHWPKLRTRPSIVGS